MEALKESIRLIDWWLKGTSPEFYTHRSIEGLNFDLDGFLNWQDGQLAAQRDIADFYAQAIREIANQGKPIGLLAFIYPRQNAFKRMGITPLSGTISLHNAVGLPYLIVRLGDDYPIKTGNKPRETYLKGVHAVVITDQVTSGTTILDAARTLKNYGAEDVLSAVSLIVKTREVTHSADFLMSRGIDLTFSHEMWVDNSALKFNPNASLL